MIKIDPLFFLLLLQSMLICAGIAVVLFLQHRKLKAKALISQDEVKKLEADVMDREHMNVELINRKSLVEDMKAKFEQIRGANGQLKESIAGLIPEAEKSKEYEKIIAVIEQSNKELDTCIGTLQKENDDLNEKIQSAEREAEGLADLLQKSVRREELERAVAQKKGLISKIQGLEDNLDSKTKEFDQLEKQYKGLEKEFNALYENVEGAKTT